MHRVESTFTLTLVLLLALPAKGYADDHRVEYCRGTGFNFCEQTGEGYTICESLRSALDSTPAEKSLPVCDVAIPNFGFEHPDWQPMPVTENMRAIYDIELFLAHHNPTGIYPQLAPMLRSSPPTSWDARNPATWRRVPYDIWLPHYQDLVERGELESRLSFATVRLNEGGPVKLIKYERSPGGAKAQCEADTRVANGNAGAYLFAAGDTTEQPVQYIARVSDQPHEVLLFEGEAVIARVNGPERYLFDVLVALPPNSNHGYVALDRCGLREIEKP